MPPHRATRGVPTRLLGLGTALPALRVSQPEALTFILDRYPLRPATRALYRRVFANESVRSRRFALRALGDIRNEGHDVKNARFEREGVRLSVRSLKKALARARLSPRAVDFLAVATCTGYVCPGLAAQTAAAGGLRRDVEFADLVGMGCGAALPALQAAYNFCRAHPGATAAIVCTEICSAAMVSGDAADLVVSNALFGDGSAAAILRAGPGRGPALRETVSTVVPEWRDGLRFVSENGHLRNVLAKEVPERAAAATAGLLDRILEETRTARPAVRRWVLHAGGAKVLDALRQRLGLAESDLAASRAVLRRTGNLSSPTVLFVLEESLRRRPPRRGERAFMASFGAGFSAHAALWEF